MSNIIEHKFGWDEIIYTLNGELHNDNDEPAVLLSNGDRLWFTRGKLNRLNDYPAVVLNDGYREWRVDGIITRMDKFPAIIDGDGNRFWLTDGKLHRVKHAAAIFIDGREAYYTDGVYQRGALEHEEVMSKITGRHTFDSNWYINYPNFRAILEESEKQKEV